MGTASAVAAPPPANPTAEDLAKAKGLDPRQVGFILLDPASGQILEQQRADQAFIPASTVKLITARMALKVLGAEHRFVTRLTAVGRIADGTLRGDLVMEGSGDPKLVMDDITAMVHDLAGTGLRRITGRFLIDDGALPVFLRIDPTQPPQSPSNAGVSALSSEFNRVTVGWQKVRRGKKNTLSTWIAPSADNLKTSLAKPGLLPRDAINPLIDDDGSTTFQLAADRSTSGALAFPVADPSLQTGALVRTAARQAGISLPPPQRGTAPGGTTLVSHDSAPVRALVADMLHYSNNQMAELLGLATAARLAETPASLQGAALIVQQDLSRRIPAFATPGTMLANLSGLSARSRLTPHQLAALLADVSRSPDGPSFLSMMAEGGLSGTMRGRLSGQDTIGRVHAKTGTMAYASSLAGYLDGHDGRRLVFAIMTLDAADRAAYDASAGDRKPLDGPTLRWLDRARAFQDALVAGWIARY